jgi:cellulose synthase/poly-beta-1,6-N-acetylglucosamine synthase-like glycosyltransferase
MKCLFWVSAALVAYTYAGYAVWLWVRARIHAWPVRRGAAEPAVSIVMVVRNEEQVLDDKLRNLLGLDYPADRCQIVVVSDGSTDRTEEILRTYGSNPRLHVVMNQLSRGKACGLNDALEWAQGELVVFTDARQMIEPSAVRLILENFADPEVGCASGELMLGDPESGETARGTGAYWKIEKLIRELESASGSVVGATGAFYAVRHSLVGPLPMGTILDDVYIPMNVVRRGFRVVFDARARAWDRPDLGAEREFGRKVRTLTGNYQLLQLAPWLLTAKNPIRFEFISHKLVRLLAPFALAGALAASIFLSGVIYRVALILQLAFYGLSLLTVFPLKSGPLTRMADAALTFIVLNTAAIVAFTNFVTGRKAAWVR